MYPPRYRLSPRIFLLTLFAISMVEFAHAGADPTATDWLPRFYNIQLDQHRIRLNSDNEEFIFNSAELDKAASTPINLLAEKIVRQVQVTSQCSLPSGLLQKYRNENSEPRILICNDSEEAWFATSAYCGEGAIEDPGWNQGYLYSYTFATKEVKQYKEFLPSCAELVDLKKANNMLIGVTLYQSEYSQSAGEVITLNLTNRSAPPKTYSNPKATGAVVALSNYDSNCDCLWFTTEEGIERLTLGSGIWEQRYFDYKITPENQFVFTLSATKPDSEKMWLGKFIYNHPISDLKGFVSAWKQAAKPEYEG